MNYEKSCGAVVFTRDRGEIRYALIHQTAGHWGFPKGHVEPGETERETALREISEETGLHVTLLKGFRTFTQYPLPRKPGVVKQVVYFLAQFSGQEISVQEAEVQNARLLPYAEALALLQHEDSRRILTQADNFLTGRHSALPDLIGLLKLLEPRPELYIGNRDITALDQFLGGFCFAAMQEHPGFDNWLHRDFRDHLAEKYADTRTVNWCHLIRDHEPDGHSTDAFFRMVHEFLDQR